MKAIPFDLRYFLAAVCILTAAHNKVYGQAELYAGSSENRFSLLRDSASTMGFEFGGRYGVLSWLALDVGYTNFGKVSSAFPFEDVATPPPGDVVIVGGSTVEWAGVPVAGLTVIIPPPSMGKNSFHVDARAVYLLPELAYTFGHHLSGSLGFGLARFESKIGGNLFFEQMQFSGTLVGSVPPAGWLPIYSGTRRSWTGLGRASLRAAVSRSWRAEAGAQLTGAPAFCNFDPAGNIGRRRLEIIGGTVGLVWQLPAR